MATTLQAVSRRLTKHVADDEKLHRESNEALKANTNAISDLATPIKGVVELHVTFKKLVTVLWRAIGVAALALLGSVVSALYQGHTAQVAAQKAASAANVASAAVNTSAIERAHINTKLETIQAQTAK